MIDDNMGFKYLHVSFKIYNPPTKPPINPPQTNPLQIYTPIYGVNDALRATPGVLGAVRDDFWSWSIY
jgi:hypothetical protein